MIGILSVYRFTSDQAGLVYQMTLDHERDDLLALVAGVRTSLARGYGATLVDRQGQNILPAKERSAA